MGDEIIRARSTNGGEEARVYIIGGKARRKEIATKTRALMGG
jgi:hypothetical protein